MYDSNLAAQKARQWDDIVRFLGHFFYRPDTQAIKILLGAYAAQFYINEKPLCILLIGPSGYGKSEIGIKALQKLPKVESETDLSKNSLISGWGDDLGILQRISKVVDKKSGLIEGYGVLVFSDLTPMLNKPHDDRAQIIGALRRVADGEYERSMGTGKVSWRGKVTVIAASTPAIEDFWATMREMGERYVIVHWHVGDSSKQQEYLDRHLGKEKEITNGYVKLVQEFMLKPFPVAMSWDQIAIDPVKRKGLFDLANLVCKLRATISRAGNGQVTKVVDPEGPGRIYKATQNLIRGLCSMFYRPATDEDYDCAYRMAVETVPINRLKVLMGMVDVPPGYTVETCHWDANVLCKKLKMPPETFRRVTEDMEWCGILVKTEAVEGLSSRDYIGIHPDFSGLEPILRRYKAVIDNNRS